MQFLQVLWQSNSVSMRALARGLLQIGFACICSATLAGAPVMHAYADSLKLQSSRSSWQQATLQELLGINSRATGQSTHSQPSALSYLQPSASQVLVLVSLS